MYRLSRRALLKSLPLLWVGTVGAAAGVSCSRSGIADPTTAATLTTPTFAEPTPVGDPTMESPAPTSEPPTQADSQRTIIVADVTDSSWTRFGRALASSFAEIQPDVEISWRSVTGWPSYPQRIATLHASGLLGDVVEAPFGVMLAHWARHEVIRPLDSLLQQESTLPGDIFVAALAACHYDGQLFGLPIIAHAGESLLLAHTPSLEEAGLAAPGPDQTLDDLVTAARRLANDQGTGPGRFGYGSQWGLPSVYPILHAFGGRLISDDGREARITEEEGVACLRWLADLTHTWQVSPQPLEVAGGLLNMLRRGRIAMLRHTFGAYQALVASGAPITANLHPRHPSASYPTLMSGVAYCITSQSQAPEAALHWMRYLSSREAGVRMLLEGYSVPGCRISSWTDARVVERFPVCAQIAAAADSAAVEALPWNERVTELYALWGEHAAPLWRGEIEAETCAQTLNAAIEALLELPPHPNGLAGSAPPNPPGT